MSGRANIAAALKQRAAERPEDVAMYYPAGFEADGRIRYRALSYRALDTRSDAIAAGLTRYGIGRGVRAALMVRPSPELFLLMFALFKAGAVPVLIDPGIDRRALKQCLDEAAPQAFIGIPLAQAARLLLGWARRSVERVVTVGRRWFWGGATLAEIEALGRGGAGALADTAPEDLAAILFTSGSTGVPKGVEYRHRHFLAQVELLRDAFDIRPGEVDLPTFPPFALFDPALGMTTVVPLMDPTRPARADPRRLIEAIERFGVTTMFGSPALLRTLTRHAVPAGVCLPTLRRVISAGAPVPPELVEQCYRLLPADARLYTPYGATECLPVAVVEGRELLGDTRRATEAGAGICVGRPLPANRVRVIRIDDGPIEQWSEDLVLPTGVIGEITVLGPTTTERYYARDQATRLAKIASPDGVVHRMGDLGYFDADGRLWYCGRKSHRVETTSGPLYTEPVEQIVNTHPDVARSALVGIGPRGREQPWVWIERAAPSRSRPWPSLEAELRALAGRHEVTRRIQHFAEHPGFPVDIRHNAKIGRERLRVEAHRRAGRSLPESS